MNRLSQVNSRSFWIRLALYERFRFLLVDEQDRDYYIPIKDVREVLKEFRES